LHDDYNKLKKDTSMTDINIFVNGNRCKTYIHEGKTYLEGKPGSEYEIEIKNNTSTRIETVATVDGLSVMSGKAGTTEEGGYVIDAYASYRIKGFRYSNEKCGGFKFNTKNYSYAATKGDNSEINCGVIACKIYREKIVIPKYIKTYPRMYPIPPNTDCNGMWYVDDMLYGSATTATISATGQGGLYGEGKYGSNQLKSRSAPIRSANCAGGQTVNSVQNSVMYSSCCPGPEINETPSEVFSLGTSWGSDKVSKVVNTTFNRDGIIADYSIYYTTREGLIILGVPLTSPAKVNLPESFPGNYAKPPAGWQG